MQVKTILSRFMMFITRYEGLKFACPCEHGSQDCVALHIILLINEDIFATSAELRHAPRTPIQVLPTNCFNKIHINNI